MMNFCTLYDSNYISKGIALYLSIAKYTDDFTMYVMAMDRKCEEILTALNLSHIVVECIEDNTSPELSEAKANRSLAEYCWTCGSYVTHFFMTSYNLSSVTYLDSDLMFFSSPQVIFDELEEKNASVGLSPHYTPYCASGKYCVQYCYFKNNKSGLDALTWWKNECLKWCYSIIEDGKYADQLYLEKMPSLFQGVIDITNRGAGIANWNSYLYKLTDNCLEFQGQKYPFVFFHYSGYNISYSCKRLVVKECFKVSPEVEEYFIVPYVQLLKRVFEDYLFKDVDKIEYIKDTSFLKWVINIVDSCFIRYEWWHKFKAFLITKKYKKRHSPYSEHQ